MKRIFVLVAMTTLLLTCAYAQKPEKLVTKFKFEGFNVTLVPSTEFSYTYDENYPTSEELKGDKLTLKVIDKKDKSQKSNVTINFVDIQSLDLENCVLLYNTAPLTVNKLDLKMDESTTVNLQAEIKSLSADLNNESKLGLEGYVGNAKIKLNKHSMTDSYKLKADKYSLSGSDESVAHLGLESKNVTLEAKSQTVYTVSGKTKSLKAKAEKLSRIDATTMEVDKADISYKGESRITVKAKHLKSNSKL